METYRPPEVATKGTYFIIEHPTRGTLMRDPNPDTGNPKFSWSKPRSALDVARYYTLRRAIHDCQELCPPGSAVVQAPPQGSTALWREVWPEQRDR